jgi:hypothetical protein
VSSCDKPGDTAATNETDENASTQESLKKKKQELLNFYGFVEDSELKQLVRKATVNKDGTEHDIAKTIYGIILYKTSINNMDDKNIKTWSITDAYPSKLLYHVHILLHHDPGPQQTNQNERTRVYRNVIERILFMEITRAAKLVISNTDENQPFSITNSVCNQQPNAYCRYTLDSFVGKIDKETKNHLFYDPIRKVFKDYLDKHVSTPAPGQEQHTIIIDIQSEDGNSGITSRIASPPRTYHIQNEFRSILQKLHSQWNNDQKSIWKIYDETQQVTPEDVLGMQNVGVTALQLRNMYHRYSGLDVSESPFRNNKIAHDNRIIAISDMLDKSKPEVFRILYDMLKELTLIQEENYSSTGFGNSNASENNDDFNTLKNLITELKRKYNESLEEWNELQVKQDVNLIEKEHKDTIEPTIITAQQIVKILFNNVPFQSEDSPFKGCSPSSIELLAKKTLNQLFEDTVFRGRITRFCSPTHQTTDVNGPSALAPRRSGDPARNVYEMFCGNDFLLGEQLAQVFPKIDKVAKMTTPAPFEKTDTCQLQKNEEAKNTFHNAGVQFGLIAVWNINQEAFTPGNTTQPSVPIVFTDKKDYGAFLYTPYTKNPASHKLIYDKLQHIVGALKSRDNNNTFQKYENNVVITSEPESALTFFTNKQQLTRRATNTLKQLSSSNP